MRHTATTTSATRLSIANGVYFSPASEDGCIVLNLERGTILSLNGTGAVIFSRLAESKTGLTHDELVASVVGEFENVELSRVEGAVESLLARLEKAGALRTEQTTADVTKRWDVRAGLGRRVPVCVRYLLVPLLFVKAYTFAALILLLTTDGVRKLGGFRSIHGTVEQWALAMNTPPDDATIANACAAVNRACTWHPKRALCLQRTTALVCLLRSLGLPAEMVIGVHKMPFYGHAWAEVEGRVVNDHANAQRFSHVLSRC